MKWEGRSMRQPNFYSRYRRAGGLIFVSGQLAFDEDGHLIEGEIESQTKRCVERIADVLSEENLTMDSVVKCGCRIVDPLHFDRFNAAYLEFFRDRALPARSTVVSRLCMPGALVEIDAVIEAPVTS